MLVGFFFLMGGGPLFSPFGRGRGLLGRDVGSGWSPLCFEDCCYYDTTSITRRGWERKICLNLHLSSASPVQSPNERVKVVDLWRLLADVPVQI